MNISSDDPRLTAYAVGELDEQERREIERSLQADPALRDEIESIRGTAQLLVRELAGEPLPALTTEQRRQVASPPSGMGLSRRGSSHQYLLLRWGLVAAALAIAAMSIIVTDREVFRNVRVDEKQASGGQGVATPCPGTAPAPSTAEHAAAPPKAVGRSDDAARPRPQAESVKTHRSETSVARVPGSDGAQGPLGTMPFADNDAEAEPLSPPPPAPVVQEGMVALEIELPKPMFVGTPKNIVSANLETPTGKLRPPFHVPKGVKNVAENKPVTSSDPEPIIGELAMATDGDKEGADGSYIEFGPRVQWVQVDLEGEFEVFAIVFWHYHSRACVYHDVVVQVSDDPNFTKGIVTLFNNDDNNTARLGVGEDKEYIETNEGRLVDARGVRARYVRLYSNGNTSNDMNHLIEVEVYGRPAR